MQKDDIPLLREVAEGLSAPSCLGREQVGGESGDSAGGRMMADPLEYADADDGEENWKWGWGVDSSVAAAVAHYKVVGGRNDSTNRWLRMGMARERSVNVVPMQCDYTKASTVIHNAKMM